MEKKKAKIVKSANIEAAVEASKAYKPKPGNLVSCQKTVFKLGETYWYGGEKFGTDITKAEGLKSISPYQERILEAIAKRIGKPGDLYGVAVVKYLV